MSWQWDHKRTYRILKAGAAATVQHCIEWIDAYDLREAPSLGPEQDAKACVHDPAMTPAKCEHATPAEHPSCPWCIVRRQNEERATKAARCPFCAVVFDEDHPAAPFGPNDMLLCAKCIRKRQPKSPRKPRVPKSEAAE